MVTTPTSVKSFMLKLVELLHKLDTSRLERAEIREDHSGAAGGIRHARLFFSFALGHDCALTAKDCFHFCSVVKTIRSVTFPPLKTVEYRIPLSLFDCASNITCCLPSCHVAETPGVRWACGRGGRGRRQSWSPWTN